MPSMLHELEEKEWEVKHEILEKLKKDKEQPKTITHLMIQW